MNILIGVLVLTIAAILAVVWQRRRGIPLFGRGPTPVSFSDSMKMTGVMLIVMVGVDFLSDDIQVWFQEIFSQSEAGFGLRMASVVAATGVFVLLSVLANILLQKAVRPRI